MAVSPRASVARQAGGRAARHGADGGGGGHVGVRPDLRGGPRRTRGSSERSAASGWCPELEAWTTDPVELCVERGGLDQVVVPARGTKETIKTPAHSTQMPSLFSGAVLLRRCVCSPCF